MTNDAKLGLLVGTAGVLVAAVMFGPKGAADSSVTAAMPREPAKAATATPDLPTARAAVPTPRPATPSMPAAYVAKSKAELEGTAVPRKGRRAD